MKNLENFRPEIEGVRAIAALLVAAYHIWLGRVSGGVDIFFVVSGYLITTALLKRTENSRRFEPFSFWAGLVSRLFPTALFVLACTGFASIFLLPKSLWLDTSKQILASALYLENWKLAFSSIDYLARDEPPSPVQHYWALSTQGQFYAIWPVVVWISSIIGIKNDWSIRRSYLFVSFFVFSSSLAYSIYSTEVDQPFAYFNTFARVWEFAVGGILAATSNRRTTAIASAHRHLMGWLGLVGILLCGVVLDVSTAFPGYAALWPTLSAVLILTAPRSSSPFSVVNFLSNRCFIWLGGMSYALYLWHWPILIFYRHSSGVTKPTAIEGLAIICASIALAWFSTRYIETPLRNFSAKLASLWKIYAVSACMVFPVAMGSYLWNRQVQILLQRPVPIARDYDNYPGALAFEPGYRYSGNENTPLRPDFFQIKNDIPISYGDGCHLKIEEVAPKICNYGASDGKKTVVLVGASHAAHWLAPLLAIAEQQNWKLISLTKSGCLFTTESQTLSSGRDYSECTEWNDLVVEELGRMKPTAIITTGTRIDSAGEKIPDGYSQRWSELLKMGIPVILIRDTPLLPMDAAACIDRHGRDSKKCKAQKRDIFLKTNPLTELKSISGIASIDMTNYFCDSELCPPTKGNIIIYHDTDHISVSYARTLSEPLSRELRIASPQLFLSP